MNHGSITTLVVLNAFDNRPDRFLITPELGSETSRFGTSASATAQSVEQGVSVEMSLIQVFKMQLPYRH